jgi:hypothetical protein
MAAARGVIGSDWLKNPVSTTLHSLLLHSLLHPGNPSSPIGTFPIVVVFILVYSERCKSVNRRISHAAL